MKKISHVVFLILVIFLGIFSGYMYGKYSVMRDLEKNKIHINYGEDFTKIEVKDHQNRITKLEPKKNDYLLIIYLDSKCGACYRQLEAVDRWSRIFENQMEIVVLWGGERPEENYQELGIDNQQIYSLEDKLALSDSPAGIIINEQGKVVFLTTEMSKITEKVLSLEKIDKEKIVENTNEYLASLFVREENKIPMVYFAMEGCKDCEAADTVIDQEVLDKYEIVRIYDETEYGEKELVDLNNIFVTVYEIDWYPSFLILNNQYKLIGNTPVEELKATLMNSVE